MLYKFLATTAGAILAASSLTAAAPTAELSLTTQLRLADTYVPEVDPASNMPLADHTAEQCHRPIQASQGLRLPLRLWQTAVFNRQWADLSRSRWLWHQHVGGKRGR